jgi:hypothetical protein
MKSIQDTLDFLRVALPGDCIVFGSAAVWLHAGRPTDWMPDDVDILVPSHYHEFVPYHYEREMSKVRKRAGESVAEIAYDLRMDEDTVARLIALQNVADMHDLGLITKDMLWELPDDICHAVTTSSRSKIIMRECSSICNIDLVGVGRSRSPLADTDALSYMCSDLAQWGYRLEDMSVVGTPPSLDPDATHTLVYIPGLEDPARYMKKYIERGFTKWDVRPDESEERKTYLSETYLQNKGIPFVTDSISVFGFIGHVYGIPRVYLRSE